MSDTISELFLNYEPFLSQAASCRGFSVTGDQDFISGISALRRGFSSKFMARAGCHILALFSCYKMLPLVVFLRFCLFVQILILVLIGLFLKFEGLCEVKIRQFFVHNCCSISLPLYKKMLNTLLRKILFYEKCIYLEPFCTSLSVLSINRSFWLVELLNFLKAFLFSVH